MENYSSSYPNDETMRVAILNYLIGKAKRGLNTHYDEIQADLNLPINFRRNPHHRNWLFNQLDQINAEEVGRGHPPITSIVVKRNIFIPGDGFYNWLHKSGELNLDKPLEELSIEEKSEIYGRFSTRTKQYWRSREIREQGSSSSDDPSQDIE